MHVRLLFITSHYFYQPTCEALQRLKPDCQTKVIPYDDFSHIPEIYRQHQDWCDAVMLSGISAKKVLEIGCPGITKPVSAFQVDSDGLHRDVLRYALERRSLDFDRVAMDFMLPMGSRCTVADFLEIDDIQDVFKRNQEWMQEEQVQRDGAEQLILSRIEELWAQDKIVSVICMYSGIIPKLQELGIPYRCPFLSDPHLKRLIRDVLIKIELQKLHDNHPAVIQIFPTHMGSLSPEEMQSFERHIRAFTQTNLIECIIQHTDACCTLITTLQVVRFLTEEFRGCRICTDLQSKVHFPVTAGYGIGTTVTHAMNNAQIASREAKILGMPFAMDSNGNLIGPMNSHANMVISQGAMLKLGDIAGRASLSAMTIQKILSILHNRGSDKITTQELADSMNTTIRNANRIMHNLQKGGFASPVYTQTSHSRGRPVQVYMISFPLFSD